MNTAGAPSQNNTASYRVLKGVVIFLGALILLAFGALVVGLIFGIGPQGPAERAGEPFLATVALGPGAQVVEVELDGERALMWVIEGGQQNLIFLDARSGRILGRVVLETNP